MSKDVHTHWNEDGHMTHEHTGGYLQHDHFEDERAYDRLVEMGLAEWLMLFFAAVGVVAFGWWMIVLLTGLFG